MVVDIAVLVGVPMPDPLAMAKKNTGNKKQEIKMRSHQLAHHLGALKGSSKQGEAPDISSSNETETSTSAESTESSSTPEARNDSRMRRLLRRQLQRGEMILSKCQDTSKEKQDKDNEGKQTKKKDKQGRQTHKDNDTASTQTKQQNARKKGGRASEDTEERHQRG